MESVPNSLVQYLKQVFFFTRILDRSSPVIGNQNNSKIKMPIMLRNTILGILILLSLNKLVGARETVVIRFFSFENLLLIPAQIEGQNGFLILDTGAPHLILNKRYFDDKKNFQGNLTARGFNGKVAEVLNRETSLKIDQTNWGNLQAQVISLEHLKPSRNFPILGLAGIQLFIEFELVLDYKTSTLILFRLDKKGNITEPQYNGLDPDIYFPIKLKGHVPYLEVILQNYPLKLGLDTGSEITLINPKFKSKIENNISPAGDIQLLGTDQNNKQFRLWKLRNLNVSMLSFPPLNLAFININAFNNGLPGSDLDGILGSEFFCQFTTSINLKKKELRIWINSRASALLTKKK